MNRDRVTINWRFTRKQARLKFGYIKKQHYTVMVLAATQRIHPVCRHSFNQDKL